MLSLVRINAYLVLKIAVFSFSFSAYPARAMCLRNLRAVLLSLVPISSHVSSTAAISLLLSLDVLMIGFAVVVIDDIFDEEIWWL